uniref:Pex N-terminal domain-containing protein n=1 Tax=Arion vulgaris TaxID=1028688 RepID=A0A0B6ZNE8_9EUPU
MAEHGAHLTSGGVTDTNRPSVFEVLAQENLMSTIRPAIRHALRVFSERYPEQLGRLIQNFDEIFLLLDTLVQSYYLKKYGGSFAENFYDLKRVPSGSPDQPLLSKHRMMSVACLVLIPYVRQKLDSYFEMLQYKEGSRQGLSFLQKKLSMKQRLIRFYLFIYPFIHSVWECMTLAYILSYILRGGRWHNPNMHLSGTELRRLDPDEELNGSDKLHDPAWSELNTTAKLSLLARMSLNTTAACLSTSLSVGVFSYSFWTGGMPVTTVHQL